jgi:hypothetical protein
MNRIKQTGNAALGLLIIVASVLFGVYVGGYLMFYGGIVQFIGAFQATPVSASDIAIGIIKVVFAGAGGVWVAFIGAAFGAAIASK